MTLEETKELFSDISFEVLEFQNEAEFFCHITPFPNIKGAKPCKVIALVAKSRNGRKNIELQFNSVCGSYHFNELYFGGYSFELFDVLKTVLPALLRENIDKIKSGLVTIISANNIRKKKWIGDACFDLSDGDAPALSKAIHRITNSKGFFAKLRRSEIQYEIYDWNTYKQIILH